MPILVSNWPKHHNNLIHEYWRNYHEQENTFVCPSNSGFGTLTEIMHVNPSLTCSPLKLISLSWKRTTTTMKMMIAFILVVFMSQLMFACTGQTLIRFSSCNAYSIFLSKRNILPLNLFPTFATQKVGTSKHLIKGKDG